MSGSLEKKRIIRVKSLIGDPRRKVVAAGGKAVGGKATKRERVSADVLLNEAMDACKVSKVVDEVNDKQVGKVPVDVEENEVEMPVEVKVVGAACDVDSATLCKLLSEMCYEAKNSMGGKHLVEMALDTERPKRMPSLFHGIVDQRLSAADVNQGRPGVCNPRPMTPLVSVFTQQFSYLKGSGVLRMVEMDTLLVYCATDQKSLCINFERVATADKLPNVAVWAFTRPCPGMDDYFDQVKTMKDSMEKANSTEQKALFAYNEGSFSLRYMSGSFEAITDEELVGQYFDRAKSVIAALAKGESRFYWNASWIFMEMQAQERGGPFHVVGRRRPSAGGLHIPVKKWRWTDLLKHYEPKDRNGMHGHKIHLRSHHSNVSAADMDEMLSREKCALSSLVARQAFDVWDELW